MTTNNRMELLAVIKGLEELKVEGIPVTIYCDSKYVVDAVQKGWIWNWQKKGFKDKKNVDRFGRFKGSRAEGHIGSGMTRNRCTWFV